MAKRLRLSPFLRNVVLTTVASIFSILSIVIVTRFLARGLGPEEFGAYSLARRALSAMVPFSSLMMSIAVTRYIGLSGDRGQQYSYLLSGLALIIPGNVIILIIGFPNMNYLASLIFHGQGYAPLFAATLFMLVGSSFYTILCAFYRGQSKMVRFNLWYVAGMGLGPLAIAWLYVPSEKAYLIVLLMGAILFLSIIPLTFHCVNAFLKGRSDKNMKVVWRLKELFLYGFPRIPGGFAYAGLFAVGPFLAPHFGSTKESGYLAISQSILRVVGGSTAAFGLVILPKVAQLSAEGRETFLKERIADIIAFVFHIGLFATLHILLWSDGIVMLWLGAQYAEAILFMRVFLIALVPFLAFTLLRSVIDAIEEKAVNALNLIVSLTIAFVFSFVLARSGLDTLGLAIGATLGFALLGTLSVLYLCRFYQIAASAFMVKRCLLLNAIFIALTLLLKGFWPGKMFSSTSSMMVAVFIEVLFFISYLLILYKWNVGWTAELRKRVSWPGWTVDRL